MRKLIGRTISAAVVAILLLDASINLFAPHLLQNEMNAVQFPAELAPVLAMIMVICAVLHALPRTSFVGAILITGFFGGAICIHLRAGELLSPAQLISFALGAAAWGGLCLRDQRLQELVLCRALPGGAALEKIDRSIL
ncbi:DoxX family protein [Rhizobiaceae bacterium n13]|uniref:DoxX family protein n=1 Tax=Ferirhizobium litorale TaxID=2927786 RepID=A0AAE3U3Q6_9HYPH|nr:DoxX family protein [Fererhizobium litorale]MDI7864708.1 DoxX family protein [Fererhizobium litorale]MDI7922199.1 DoxX family protein [Fererhizobium litorale]